MNTHPWSNSSKVSGEGENKYYKNDGLAYVSLSFYGINDMNIVLVLLADTYICKIFTDVVVQHQVPIMGVAPLRIAVQKLQPSVDHFTALHVEFLHDCFLAKCYKTGCSGLFGTSSFPLKLDTIWRLVKRKPGKPPKDEMDANTHASPRASKPTKTCNNNDGSVKKFCVLIQVTLTLLDMLIPRDGWKLLPLDKYHGYCLRRRHLDLVERQVTTVYRSRRKLNDKRYLQVLNWAGQFIFLLDFAAVCVY
ncbi:hypothetical protein C5167_003173 [Papaver somniferum]|uniref:COP9 signalosome complex subunit 3 N-terminal helical repeats domain-containing protein n=1 Tax=Papaver somniferum TaxID=3469 RepID=A0A4Y7L3Y8_PAPSO|nr:hypothetical protein C5167_003173 [Papaver somniferum]